MANKVFLIGRLTADPEVRLSTENVAVAKYTLAVARMTRRQGNEKPQSQEADFIRVVAFGKNAEFAEKYLSKGRKLYVMGRIQTGSYTGKDGKKVYTTDVVVESQEFADSKPQNSGIPETSAAGTDEFMDIPDDYDGLPFN